MANQQNFNEKDLATDAIISQEKDNVPLQQHKDAKVLAIVAKTKLVYDVLMHIVTLKKYVPLQQHGPPKERRESKDMGIEDFGLLAPTSRTFNTHTTAHGAREICCLACSFWLFKFYSFLRERTRIGILSSLGYLVSISDLSKAASKIDKSHPSVELQSRQFAQRCPGCTLHQARPNASK